MKMQDMEENTYEIQFQGGCEADRRHLSGISDHGVEH